MIVADERVARFISQKIGYPLCPPYTVMGIERDGEIIAGALFNQFEGFDVHVTIAGTGWTKGFAEAVGQYVFGQLGCLRMTATTRFPKVAEYAERLGGKVEGRLRNHFGVGQDAIIIGILHTEWKLAIVPTDSSAAELLQVLPE
ncbi:MAG: GNAT family protein [Sulfitobacter sp.]